MFVNAAVAAYLEYGVIASKEKPKLVVKLEASRVEYTYDRDVNFDYVSGVEQVRVADGNHLKDHSASNDLHVDTAE